MSHLPYVVILGQSDGPVVGPAPTEGAAADPAAGATGNGAPPPNQPSMWPFLVPLLLVFAFMIWSSSSAQKKERKKRDELLASIKKHDRVQTIGGIIGSVVEIKDNEIVLKVDEANNIKMRFSKSAVQQVLSETKGRETADLGAK